MPRQYDIDAIVNDYATMSMTQVASKHHISLRTVSKLLAASGILLRYRRRNRVDVPSLISDYCTMTLGKLSDKYKLGVTNIKKILRDNNVRTDKHGKHKILYSNIFEDKNSKLAAYWAGFLYADGCVTATGNTHVLSLVLASKDASHIYRFADALGVSHKHVNHTIRYSRGSSRHYTSLKLSVDSKMLHDLRCYGIVPRKTYNFVKPSIPMSVLPSFIRGWIDGDGHVSLGRSIPRRCHIVLVGNNYAIAWYHEICRKLGYTGNFNDTKVKKDDVYTRSAITKISEVIQLVNIIAKPEDIKLERKWVGIADMDTVRLKASTTNHSVRESAVIRLLAGEPLNSISADIGVSPITVSVWRYKYGPKVSKPRPVINKKIRSDCYHWLKLNYSPAYLAKLFKINIETVKYWKYKLGRAA